MSDVLKKAAEILVECGYAYRISNNIDGVIWREPRGCHRGEEVEPFEDTLEGRRQADAIEDCLETYPDNLFMRSITEHDYEGSSRHQWRLARIKWCLEQLA